VAARVHSTYRTLYRVGLMPWNRATASDPISAWADGRSPGVAVDLGCGTGADARHLAGLGWQVTAVDYVPKAIAMARQHDRESQVIWRVCDVTAEDQVDPDGMLAGACDLVVDNGCLHGVPAAARKGWAATVNRLAMPGAALLVRAVPPRNRGIAPAGISAADIAALLGDGWLNLDRPAPGWVHYQRSGPNGRPTTG
jgi:2-polyprenyl-3-methyl-5-hydroxy-6-metoxy-1,4-benzoquinol methylase